MKYINAFIPAAGYGERLRPLTNHIPKPLLPILGKPIIETVVERISRLPVKNIGINVNYKKDLIRNWANLSNFSGRISLFLEEHILGTGGALKNAARIFEGPVTLVHNADILSDIPLERLLEKQKTSGDVATLAVHDFPEFNNVWIDTSGAVRFAGKIVPGRSRGLRAVAFMGIAAYSPDFLGYLPEGNSSVVDAWLKAIACGQTIGTVNFTGCMWNDIGTPQAYFMAVVQALRHAGENVYIHPSVACNNVEIHGYSVLEQGSTVAGPSSIRNSILLPGSVVMSDTEIENAITGPDYRVPISPPQETALMPLSCEFLKPIADNIDENMEITSIGQGGSDRQYYRLKRLDQRAVIMVCRKNDQDFERHIFFTMFLNNKSVPVPALLNYDREKMLALFEDLGDISLYSWLKCRRTAKSVESMYMRVLDSMVSLHTIPSESASECPSLFNRVFDYEHLRWETTYFLEKYIIGIQGLFLQEHGELMQEFDRLAKTVDSCYKTVIHRDFQSQNVMITKDGPYLIDYQGARMGPPAYDLASLLWDPYASMDEAMRRQLLDYYIEKLHDFSGNRLDREQFRKTLLPCRLQRHMQALGAYGYLSKEKGKTYFLKFIPQALKFLYDESEQVRADYPILWRVVRGLCEKAGY